MRAGRNGVRVFCAPDLVTTATVAAWLELALLSPTLPGWPGAGTPVRPAAIEMQRQTAGLPPCSSPRAAALAVLLRSALCSANVCKAHKCSVYTGVQYPHPHPSCAQRAGKGSGRAQHSPALPGAIQLYPLPLCRRLRKQPSAGEHDARAITSLAPPRSRLSRSTSKCETAVKRLN